MDYAAAYSEIHAKGKYFPGYSISPYVDAIAALVDQHKPNRLCDVGAGRGLQYLKRRVHEKWGGLLPYCYDIGVKGLDEKPEGTFGGVICTDVLEHIERADVPGFLAELVAYVEPGGFLFLVISCRPSKKRLPDGRDVHLTVESPSWWIAQIRTVYEFPRESGLHDKFPEMHIVAHFDVAGHFPGGDPVWDSLA